MSNKKLVSLKITVSSNELTSLFAAYKASFPSLEGISSSDIEGFLQINNADNKAKEKILSAIREYDGERPAMVLFSVGENGYEVVSKSIQLTPYIGYRPVTITHHMWSNDKEKYNVFIDCSSRPSSSAMWKVIEWVQENIVELDPGLWSHLHEIEWTD